MTAHTHLDRSVRPPGQCPGCDLVWQANEARLATARKGAAIDRGLEALVENSPANNLEGFCTRFEDLGSHVHTCHLAAKHKSKLHQCPCGEDWKTPAR